MSTLPSAATMAIERRGRVFWEAKFRYDGRQVKRRIGPAWLQRTEDGLTPHRGRVPEGYFDKARASVKAAAIVAEYVAGEAEREQRARERRDVGVTFREVAEAYVAWLADVKSAKPSTLRDLQSIFGEPGVAYGRGEGSTLGHTMKAIGDRPAAKVTTREIEALLAKVAKTGASPSTVNKYRARISAVFNYGMRETTFGLPSNPAVLADRRREPGPDALVYYSPEEIEALARSLADGRHREQWDFEIRDEVRDAMRAEDQREAELVRVAAYTGLRLGELLALRWRDIDFTNHALTVSRAMSAGEESTPKSGNARRVTLPDQAAGALDRLSKRENLTAPGELVFVNAYGRALDGSALRRRFKKARDKAGLRPLRFHDLRHTYGSLLAASGVDLVTIQAAMGHSALATTSRYLRAKPATAQAAEFTRAFEPSSPERADD